MEQLNFIESYSNTPVNQIFTIREKNNFFHKEQLNFIESYSNTPVNQIFTISEKNNYLSLSKEKDNSKSAKEVIELLQKMNEDLVQVKNNTLKIDATTCSSHTEIMELKKLLNEAKEEIRSNSFAKIMFHISMITLGLSILGFIFSSFFGQIIISNIHFFIFSIVSISFVYMAYLAEKSYLNDQSA